MKRFGMLLVAVLMIGGSAMAPAQSYNDRYDYYQADRAVANARSFGYHDGYNDGRSDWYTGHSFRPTHDDNFRHADRGFYGAVSRDRYKQVYRESYEDGYQKGYNTAGDRGPWRRF